MSGVVTRFADADESDLQPGIDEIETPLAQVVFCVIDLELWSRPRHGPLPCPRAMVTMSGY